MKYLLDTNVISDLVSKSPSQNVRSFLNSLDENSIYLSVITIGDIQFGIHKLESSRKKERLLHWLHTDLLLRFENRIIEIDTHIMLTWGEMSQELKSIGKPMPIMDALIGATALTKHMTLVTRNEKDFVHMDIDLINPF